ncbi:glycoside hydrolase family 13 protein [Cantharellus anzutake]|uniref:glycoside hydrolase family 13 protein n=1 Tax=Cantharellus anzutake TaxID=1750568 RepID=UPI001907829E|nr:glycoside hydrolase family 13 protein [Cantharellus anzutake]KAF8323583.1 glycoside hydrolase family 13 protein [Cantharellus anzutake]
MLANTFLLVALSLLGNDGIHAAPTTYLTERAPSGVKRAIASLFQWNWVSVQNECSFLAEQGYGYVQVSPTQEHIAGDSWWTDYQAVSYTLQSKRGSLDQLTQMVNVCTGLGVGVIVDVVVNHMTGIDGGTGVASHTFSHYNYPGTYDPTDFHYCGTPNNTIEDWNSETQIETCQLANLADLNTESEKVRTTLAAHLNNLLSIGVAGLRIDAAKHIAPASLSNILRRLSKPVYITQEVVDTTGYYINIHKDAGDVQVFGYAYALKDAFLSSGVAGLSGVNSQGWLDSGLANVFVTNHDTERGGSSLSYASGNNVYTLAHVFLLSYPYGTPTVHSGHTFGNTDQGAPDGNHGTCAANGPSGGWECQHRWTVIVNMIQFYNQVGSATLNNVAKGNSQQLAYGRGSAGHVAINNDDSAWTVTLSTNLVDGKYCDVVEGSKSVNSCTGPTITVKGGSFQVMVPPRQAMAIHTGAKL